MSNVMAVSNVLGLFTEDGEVSIENTCEFLELSRTQLASAFGVSENSIRQDRMSQRTKNRFFALAEAMERVAMLFDEHQKKNTRLWFRLPNPNFGGASPRTLIIRRRFEVVMKFIEASSSGY